MVPGEGVSAGPGWFIELGFTLCLNWRALPVDGWSSFLRGDDGLLAGAAEVLSGTGVWSGLLED